MNMQDQRTAQESPFFEGLYDTYCRPIDDLISLIEGWSDVDTAAMIADLQSALHVSRMWCYSNKSICTGKTTIQQLRDACFARNHISRHIKRISLKAGISPEAYIEKYVAPFTDMITDCNDRLFFGAQSIEFMDSLTEDPGRFIPILDREFD